MTAQTGTDTKEVTTIDHFQGSQGKLCDRDIELLVSLKRVTDTRVEIHKLISFFPSIVE